MKIRILYLLFALGVCAIWTSGCNTVHGIGKDVEKAGDKIEDSAEKHS